MIKAADAPTAGAPTVAWDEIGSVATSNGPHHTARTLLAVSTDGRICLTVEQSLCGDDPDGPEVVFALGKAEQLYSTLGAAIAQARSNAVAQNHAVAADVKDMAAALSFAASVIKSGEPWTAECESRIGGAVIKGTALAMRLP